jgi:exodeoxyribonuclease VII large subunit
MEKQRETYNERPVYSLSEITKSIESVVAKTYTRAYYIKAEILKLNYYPHSGHCYPELVEKEDGKIKAQMKGVIWSNQFRVINERFLKMTGDPLKENIGILFLATIEFNSHHGLSLFIQDIDPSYTLGEIAKNIKEVIERLKKEEVFDANRSLKLPLVPKKIAVISVETSKGYSDFMVTLKQNHWNYCFETELFPSILQGDRAAVSLVSRLEEIEKLKEKFDVVVIVRGGGGDVGMSCYDEYLLAHKVATFPLPVITGIGHSTNETVTDMVAYQNKITPTEVAYFLIQQYNNFAVAVEDMQNTIVQYVSQKLVTQRLQLDQWEESIYKTARFIVQTKQMEVETTQQSLKTATLRFIDLQKRELERFETTVQLLSPENILKKGYSITYLNGKAVKDKTQVKENDILTTRLYDGEVKSIVIHDKS